MHLVKMTMKWPSSMISRGPKMFRYKIHWKLTFWMKKPQNVQNASSNKNQKVQYIAFEGGLNYVLFYCQNA